MEGLNAHEAPPDVIRQLQKKYQRVPLAEIDSQPDIIDLKRVDKSNLPAGGLLLDGHLPCEILKTAFAGFLNGDNSHEPTDFPTIQDVPIFTHPAVSGQPSRITSQLCLAER